MPMRMIYIDMDDVVADWSGMAEKVLKKKITPGGQRIPNEDWEVIKKNKRFYRLLPLKSGAHELVEYITNYVKENPDNQMAFLTAIPRENDMIWAAYDKFLWGRQHFPHVPVFIGPYSADKHKHAKPGDILIDDRASNIESWNQAGGIGYLYREWKDCKVWLDKTLK